MSVVAVAKRAKRARERRGSRLCWGKPNKYLLSISGVSPINFLVIYLRLIRIPHLVWVIWRCLQVFEGRGEKRDDSLGNHRRLAWDQFSLQRWAAGARGSFEFFLVSRA